MNRAASEHRKTTASAMSPTSPRRPSGVWPITSPTAASTLGASPREPTMSLASFMPMSVGTSPG